MFEKLPRDNSFADESDKHPAEIYRVGGVDGLGELIDIEPENLTKAPGTNPEHVDIQNTPEDPLDLTTPHRFNKARAVALGIGVVATVGLMAYGAVRRHNQGK